MTGWKERGRKRDEGGEIGRSKGKGGREKKRKGIVLRSISEYHRVKINIIDKKIYRCRFDEEKKYTII